MLGTAALALLVFLAGCGSGGGGGGGTTVTVPGAPTGVSAVAGVAVATVSFVAPASSGGSAITSYTVRSNPGGITATGTASPIVVRGLAGGTTYTFTVTATNMVGTGSASTASNSVTPTSGSVTVPSAPTITSVASDAPGDITVAFVVPNSNGGSAITSYTATTSTGGFAVSGPASPLTITGVTAGAVVTVSVTATNAIGTGPASAASGAVTVQGAAAVPGAPTAASAVAGTAAATVSFTAPSSDGGSTITSYTVTSSPGGITAAGTASPIVVDGLTGGTSYDFTVTASNAIGTGPASAASNAVTPTAGSGLPSAPGFSLVLAAIEGATLYVTPPASNGGSAVTSFIATSIPGGITGTSDGASARIDVHGLTAGTSYTFTVQAVNANGTGAASAPSSSVTAIAYAPYWVADGFSYGINPAWGTSYTYAGISNYGYSGSPFSAYPVGSTVIQMNVTSAFGGFQPYILSTLPLPVGSPNLNNGIFDLTPYTNLTLSVYPTIAGNAQTLDIYFEASIYFFGTAGSGSDLTTLVDPTQNWTVNQWQNYVFTDEATGDQGSVTSNTATSLTLSGMSVAPAAGDSYNLAQPDQAIGQDVNLPSLASYGPTTMISGQWNTYTIPLSAFNASGSPVAGTLILKFGVQDQTGSATNTFYVTSLGFQ